MNIGVLAVQGAFIEHENMLRKLGVNCFEIRKTDDLQQPFHGLILPGGESTVQGKLLHSLQLFTPLKEKIEQGLPVLGTCAGLILLAQNLSNDSTVHFGTMPITVKRNAYGRQLGSFYTETSFKGLGTLPMTFIRAPYIQQVEDSVEILATVNENVVVARYQNQLGLSFHPELNESCKIHQMFLDMVSKYGSISIEQY